MRLIRLAALPVLLLPVLAGAARALEPEEVARRLDPSVVRIFVVMPGRVETGTGFVVNRAGVVATNYHVVSAHVERGADMFVSEGGIAPEQRLETTLIEAFPEEDIALIEVEGLERPPAELAVLAEGEPAKGTRVYVVGFPGAGDRLGPVAEASFASGTVSRRFTGAWSAGAPEIGIIQHTAPTNPGNSGGPLVDACGRVIGVNTQRETQIVLGPGGIPLVTDPIQGVFFSSSSALLIDKLAALGIPFAASDEPCRAGAPAWYATVEAMAALAVVLVALVALVAFYRWRRPRAAVQVVVRCGEVAEECVDQVEQVMTHLRRRGTPVREEVAVARGEGRPEEPKEAAPDREEEPEDRAAAGEAAEAGEGGPAKDWVLAGTGPGGRPVRLKVTADELTRKRGVTIGRRRLLGPEGARETTVSRRHAKLVPAGDGIGLVALKSAYGTWVDAAKLEPWREPAPLAPGVEVRLGDVRLTVERG